MTGAFPHTLKKTHISAYLFFLKGKRRFSKKEVSEETTKGSPAIDGPWNLTAAITNEKYDNPSTSRVQAVMKIEFDTDPACTLCLF